MKVRKILVLLTTICMLYGLVACGDNATNTGNETNEITEDEENISADNAEDEDISASDEITLETLLEYEASSENDFMCSGTDTEQYINVYEGDDEIVVIPETINGLSVTKIDGYVFANDSPVKAVKFADSIRTVSQGACGLNNNLEIVVCGSSLESIGAGAFQNCEALREVQLNEGLKTIGDFAFSGCTNLESLYIPSSVDNISFMAFIGTDNLTIYGESGSYAETFASDNNIPFAVVE